MKSLFWLTAFTWLTAPTSEAGLIYWTDRASGMRGVGECRQDGTNIRHPVNLQGRIDPRGVAFSYRLNGGGLFFADSSAVLGVPIYLEGGLSGGGPTLIAAGGVALRDILIDEAGGWLYYADEGGNAVNRTGLTMQPPDPVVIFPKPLPSVYFLAVDSAAGMILGGTSGPRLWRQQINGSASSETLTWDASLGIALDEVRGVCVDPTGGWLYWCDKDLARVARARYDGTAVLKAPYQVLYSGLNAPHGLALDLEAGKLYWVDSGTNGASGFGRAGVNRGDLDGSSAPESLVVPPNSGQPWDLCLDLSEQAFDAYIARFFRKDDPGTIKARDADPDGDGLNNELEYALVGNPRRSEGSLPLDPSLWVDRSVDPPSGEQYPAVTYRTREGEQVTILKLEISFDLLNWYWLRLPGGELAISEVALVRLPDGVVEITRRSTVPISQQPTQFFRASAERLMIPN